MKKGTISGIIIFGSLLFSCKKLVEVQSPITSLTSNNVYTSDATAAAVLTGIYATLGIFSPTQAQSVNAISLVCALSSDELSLFGGAANSNQQLVEFYLNNLTPGPSSGTSLIIWDDLYLKLYIVNLALERLLLSNSLTPSVKQQLTGEAKFLRAFFYFYLVNLYGDVPLTTTSNYNVNSFLSRTPLSQVYQQIITDLKDAQSLLSNDYVASDAKSYTMERVRPNKWAATALLARTYLYEGKYDSAEVEASAIIENTSVFNLDSLNDVFLKNSAEAIWQLQPVNAGWNTEDARVFILPSTGPTSNSNFPVFLSNQLLISFEPNDRRRLKWVDSVIFENDTFYFPYKYKSATLNAPVTEYLMVLRVGEQYLIRAEARAEQNNLQGSKADLDIIRSRAGLPHTLANNMKSLLTAILHERQTELFTEWGNRWFDLKRTGNITSVMTTVAQQKGTTWNSAWQLYPIPLYDITQDPHLIQNVGY